MSIQKLTVACLFLFVCGITALAQAGGTFSITYSTVANGGDTSSGGPFSVIGTVGQSTAGNSSSGGGFSIAPGFWPGEASGYSITGRVLASAGRGITNATVSLTGGPLAVPLVVRTTRYGGFDFEGIQPGYTYTITVTARRFGFAQPSQMITVNDNVTGIIFTSSGPVAN